MTQIIRKKPYSKDLGLTEKAIENSILEYLSAIPNCRCWKNQTVGLSDPFRSLNGRFSGKGSSDVIACINGKFVAIEVKRPIGSKVSPEQIDFIKDIIRCGGVAFLAASVQEVKEKLIFFGIIE